MAQAKAKRATKKTKAEPPREPVKPGKPIDELVGQWRDSRAREEKEFLERVDSTQLARLLLSGAGFDVEPARVWWMLTELTLKVERARLSEVRRALGCPLVFTHKGIADAKKRLAYLVFRPADFPAVTVRCDVAMPPPESSRCKIVYVQPEPYPTLVCDSVE